MQGPRSKCDQVIFEFIAKTTEIIVRSRCQVGDAQPTEEPSSGARFNFAICPVEKVRHSLQPWKHSLHVPLRVDIFYSHYPFEKNSEERILLERWCIDYVSYHEVDEQHQTSNAATSLDNAEMIIQLRQLCKKIMIALRTIYCKARMLPAYQLHCYLTQGIPLGIQRSQERGKLLQQLQHHPGQPAIGYLFYAAPHHHDDAADSYLQRNQFQQDDFRAIPTPYGTLQMSVWFHPQSNNIVLRQINSLPSSTLTTGPIQIPKNYKHHQLAEDLQYAPASAPSSNESGVHDYLIPNYSPKPESLLLKHQHRQNLNRQHHQQHHHHGVAGKSHHLQKEMNSVGQLLNAERATDMKTSMSGLSLALLQNSIESQQVTSSSRDVSESVTNPVPSNNRYRSNSLCYPGSQLPIDNGLSFARPVASETASPCGSYQPQTSYVHSQRMPQTHAKSVSPRSRHLEKHLTSSKQSLVSQAAAVLSDANNLSGVEHPWHGHGYGYGYNNPSPPNPTAASAIPIPRPLQLGRNDSNETTRSGAILLQSSSSSPRYLSSSPSPFLLQTTPLAPTYSSTPPCGRSLHKKSVLGRNNNGGIGINSDCPVSRPLSPPFVSHPLTLQREVASTEVQPWRHDTQSNRPRGESHSNTAASMLLPPSSLETLLKSPFKTASASETGSATPAMWSSMNALIPPFVPLVPVSQNGNPLPCHDPSQLYQPSPSLIMGAANSAYMFGSAFNGGGYMLSLSINSRGSSAVDPTFGVGSCAPSSPRFFGEEMPFVDTDLAAVDPDEFSTDVDQSRIDFTSSSVAAASSMAHKCATASRLSLFSHDVIADVDEVGHDGINESVGALGVSKVLKKEAPDYNNFIAELEHLAEFRDFGVLLNSNLQKLSLQ